MLNTMHTYSIRSASTSLICIRIIVQLCLAALPFKELSRQYTPCAWALVPDAPEVLMIEDLTQDARSAFVLGCLASTFEA